jgi:tape measure domain-containing protein
VATISELNIRLGLISKGLEADLKKVERSLRMSGQRLSSLGSDLTIAISAPLALLGKSAIQQAGNLESLKLAMVATFQDGKRSAAEAYAEIEALRQAALAPGLDFEQAIQGSIRLQGVGYQAEQARKTLIEMANAIALTGGTAQNLDSVTVQFAQMIAKGKVLSQDLRIIQENMPKISKLMQDAFGTQSAEALQNMGVSGREFVDKITQAASVLPRVQGGIKNAIVNAGAAARQALAALGDEIDRTFDIKGLLDRAAIAMQGIVKWFSHLSDTTKEAIVQVGLFLVSLGPFAKVTGVVITAFSALAGNLRNVISIFGGVVAGVETATKAFLSLGTVMRITVAGLAIAAVAGLVYWITQMNRELTISEKVQNEIAAVNKEVAHSIAREKSQIDLLVGVLQSETVSRDEKLRALKKLQEVAPDYFGQLKIEDGLVKGLKEAYDAWAISIQKAARAQAARERLVEISREELDLANEHDKKLQDLVKRQDDYNKSRKNAQTSVGAFAGLGEQEKLNQAFAGATANAIKQEEQAFKDANAAIQARKDALTQLIQQNGGVVDSIGKNTGETKKNEDAINAAKEKAKLYKDALKSIAAVASKEDVLGADVIGEQAKEIENQIERLIENGFKPYSAEIEKVRGMLKALRSEPIAPFAPLPTKGLPESVQSTAPAFAPQGVDPVTSQFQQRTAALNNFNNGLISASQYMQQLADITTSAGGAAAETMSMWGGAITTIGDSIANAITETGNVFQNVSKAIVNSIGEVIGMLIKQFVATLIAKSALATANPFAAIAIAGAAGAIGTALFKRLVGGAKLAQGGIIRKPTMALMGEYPGAATNPEIVAPESKLRAIFRENAGGGQVEVFGILRGADILLSSEKAQRERGRFK